MVIGAGESHGLVAGTDTKEERRLLKWRINTGLHGKGSFGMGLEEWMHFWCGMQKLGSQEDKCVWAGKIAQPRGSWLMSGEEGSGYLGLGNAKVSASTKLWQLSFSWGSLQSAVQLVTSFQRNTYLCRVGERSSELEGWEECRFTLSQSFLSQNFLFPDSMVPQFLNLEHVVLQIELVFAFLRTGCESCVLNWWLHTIFLCDSCSCHHPCPVFHYIPKK